jgi:hypothetical protein
LQDGGRSALTQSSMLWRRAGGMPAGVGLVGFSARWKLAFGHAQEQKDYRSKLIQDVLVNGGLCWGGDVWFPVFKQTG